MKKRELNYEQFYVLLGIVEDFFGYKVLTKTRTRKVIDARMILYRILKDIGYGVAHIGRYVDKDHATIINALTNFENYMEVDYKLYNTYIMLREKFYEKDAEQNPLLYASKKTLIDKVLSLEKQNKELVFVLSESKPLLDRYERIIQIIDKQSPSKERIDFLERKLNHILNGEYEL